MSSDFIGDDIEPQRKTNVSDNNPIVSDTIDIVLEVATTFIDTTTSVTTNTLEIVGDALGEALSGL